MPVYCSILATAPASTGRSSQCISLPETTATADKQCLGNGIILEVWCVRFHRWHDLFAIEETQTFADSEVYRKGFQEAAKSRSSGVRGVLAGLKIRRFWFDSRGLHNGNEGGNRNVAKSDSVDNT